MSLEQRLIEYVMHRVDETMECLVDMELEGHQYEGIEDMLASSCELAWMCKKIGVELPAKYSFDMLTSVYEEYITVHPKLYYRHDTSYATRLVSPNPSPQKQARARAILRIALESVYGLEVSDKTGFVRNAEIESKVMSKVDKRVDETLLLAEIDNMFNT